VSAASAPGGGVWLKTAAVGPLTPVTTLHAARKAASTAAANPIASRRASPVNPASAVRRVVNEFDLCRIVQTNGGAPVVLNNSANQELPSNKGIDRTKGGGQGPRYGC